MRRGANVPQAGMAGEPFALNQESIPAVGAGRHLIYLCALSSRHVQRRRNQISQASEKCQEEAAKAISSRDKENWLRLAEEWIKLAISAEKNVRLPHT
jgi:hypothetical protein